jgi:RNA polymerase sigma-70 factor (ECF subfamily)
MTEQDLIQGCIREDKECQRELFNRYAGKMLTVTRRYARHQLEAEDLLQDAFIKVFNNLKKFEGKGSFEGWIRRIAVNTALKNYNRSSFQKESIGLPDYHDSPVNAEAVSNLAEEELLKEIATLPEGYRVVFNLYVIEGYSHKEIAESLGIGESTSRSQLVKARKLLQEKLAHLGVNSGLWQLITGLLFLS